jgi:hypothetical protein
MRRLPKGYLPADSHTLIEEYQRQYVAAGRCPADDQLDRLQTSPEDLATWK